MFERESTGTSVPGAAGLVIFWRVEVLEPVGH